jgi:hypothetical protein
MGKNLNVIILLFLCLNLFSQKSGYNPVLTIKQPYHTFNSNKQQDTRKAFQKVNGLKLSESQQYLIIAYSQNPTHLVIYKVGTWERIGIYKVMGNGIEIKGSYFDENDKVLYVKYDRYSTKYKKIEFDTGYIKKVPCLKTPNGCMYEEIQQEDKEVITKNRKYHIAASKFDPSDVVISVKQ